MMQQKTVLVTGGAGYIGSHIAYILAQQGYQVIVLDNFVHDQYFNPPWAIIIRSNYADQQTLTTLFTRYTIHAVVHCAAFIEVGLSARDPLSFYHNNVSNIITLLKIMRKYNVNIFIFSSSCAVYGVPEVVPLQEQHPQQPISPYGATKAMAERILSDAHQAYGLQYVALRYFNAAGALPEMHLGEQHKHETHAIPLLLKAACTQQPFTIFGNDYPTKDGTAIRDYVHVLDIADAHVQALQHLERGNPSDCFNLGSGIGYSVLQLVHVAQQVCRTEIKTILEKRRAGDPAVLIADPTKARAILNWQPRYVDLAFIMQSALAFMKMQ